MWRSTEVWRLSGENFSATSLAVERPAPPRCRIDPNSRRASLGDLRWLTGQIGLRRPRSGDGGCRRRRDGWCSGGRVAGPGRRTRRRGRAGRLVGAAGRRRGRSGGRFSRRSSVLLVVRSGVLGRPVLSRSPGVSRRRACAFRAGRGLRWRARPGIGRRATRPATAVRARTFHGELKVALRLPAVFGLARVWPWIVLTQRDVRACHDEERNHHSRGETHPCSQNRTPAVARLLGLHRSSLPSPVMGRSKNRTILQRSG